MSETCITAIDPAAAQREWPDFTLCDSPIETLLYRDLQKVVAPKARILRQVECFTPPATFRLDFLVETPSRRVGLECDGRDYHEAMSDSARDRVILDSGHAEVIYRLRGRDIVFHLYDALDLIRAREPGLFSQRGHDSIRSLATHRNCYHDASHPLLKGFPRAMVRTYNPVEDSESGEDVEDLPTVVHWTE